jgi:hypothetical protein
MEKSKTRSPAAFSRSPGRVAEGAAPDAISSWVRPAAAAAAAAVAVAAAVAAAAAVVSSRCSTVADRLSETKQNSDGEKAEDILHFGRKSAIFGARDPERFYCGFRDDKFDLITVHLPKKFQFLCETVRIRILDPQHWQKSRRGTHLINFGEHAKIIVGFWWRRKE